ncbi:hypothetical protein DBR06_SOUSAS9910058, partial [Sousa chinensis]
VSCEAYGTRAARGKEKKPYPMHREEVWKKMHTTNTKIGLECASSRKNKTKCPVLRLHMGTFSWCPKCYTCELRITERVNNASN